MMKRAKCIESRQNKAIEEKSKLLKNLDIAEKLDLKMSKNELDKVLEIHNLKVNYNGKDIFDEISFDIKKGERVRLRGKNGSGKSSIIKLLIGEEISHTGYIKKLGNISYISQETSFLKGGLDDYIKKENIETQHLKTTLIKLGLEQIQFEKQINEWSEGQKKNY